IRRRMAGRLGAGGGPGSGAISALFPPEPQVLQEGEGQQAQERVVMEPAPGPPLEVVEPELVLELLVQLLAYPPALDQRREPLERGIGREVREVVLPLARGPVLADQPRLLAGQVPAACVGRPPPAGRRTPPGAGPWSRCARRRCGTPPVGSRPAPPR